MLGFIRSASLPLLILLLVAAWVLLEQSPEQKRGGVVLRWVVNSQERDQVYARAVKAAFEAKNPAIRIQFIKQNEGRKVDTMISGGDAPDICEVGMDKVHYYVSAGVLRDLAGLMSPADRQDLKSYFPVTLAPYVDGQKVFALPWCYVPFILFYNKNLFDKYGVPYPTDDWTWDDYLQAAIELTHDVDGDGVTDEFGASFAKWQDGYYSWIFQNGGSVLSQDGRQATFDDPEVVETVRFLEQLTRRDRVIPTDVNKPQAAGIDLFEANRLAMHGPTGSFYIPTYRESEKVDWDIASVPSGPSGRGTITAPVAFGVTSQSKHPADAYRLVRFLCGPEGQMILAQSGLFPPARREVAFSDEFLKAPGRPANKYALVAMMDDRDGKKPWGRVPPWSGNRWGDVNDEALNSKLGAFLFGVPQAGRTAESVCREIDRRADEILAEDRASYAGVPVDWPNVILWACVGAVVVLLVWILGVAAVARKSRLARSEQAWGYFAISPWLIGFVVFSLGPILFSVFLSFTRYQSLAPASSARFVGLDHYQWLLSGRDELFIKSIYATLKYVVLSVPLYLVSGLLIAMLMNSKLKGIHFFRTLYYLPAVMPVVATAVLFRWVFTQNGVLNYLAGGFGRIPPQQMPNWLQDPFWTVPAIVIMGLWGVGAGMMIYLAGLQNIPTQLYEAAQIDGAGILAQFSSITLPMLSPVLFFNLVMGVIGAFQVFTSAFVLFGGGSGPEESALFYSFYLYRKAFEQFQIGYGSALAWILFVIILALTALIFRSSSFWVYYESRREGKA